MSHFAYSIFSAINFQILDMITFALFLISQSLTVNKKPYLELGA